MRGIRLIVSICSTSFWSSSFSSMIATGKGRRRESAAVSRAIARVHPNSANLCGEHDRGLDAREFCVPQQAGSVFSLDITSRKRQITY